MRPSRHEYIGKTLQYLTVLNYDFGDDRRGYFTCRCVCGKIVRVRAENVIAKKTHSCGCMKSLLMSEANTLPNNLSFVRKLRGQYKNRAKIKKIEFTLTEEQFKTLIFKNCAYCNAPPRKVMMASSGIRKKKPFAYNGIDRIDNTLGYIYSNCAPCCHQCNQAKSDYTMEEFHNWIERVYCFLQQKK